MVRRHLLFCLSHRSVVRPRGDLSDSPRRLACKTVAAGGTELYQKAQGFSLSLMLDATYAHWSGFIRAAEWCSISFFYTDERESTINVTSSSTIWFHNKSVSKGLWKLISSLSWNPGVSGPERVSPSLKDTQHMEIRARTQPHVCHRHRMQRAGAGGVQV